MKIQFILKVYVYRRRLYIKKINSMVPFYRQDCLPVLCHYWASDYKLKLYGVMKRCFILLSHFVVVKESELF